jgi:hypothetical protein
MSKDTWIVTAYFNPCRYSTKKFNFEMFTARLKSSNANLLVIEMALPEDEFELSGGHNVIRVRGGGVMWQKERLLNIAIANLPASCTKVAWLDCDLLFEDEQWLQKTSEALEGFAVVQPFSSCVRLPRGHLEFRGEGQDDEQITESFAAAFARDRSLARDAVYREHGHTGYAWAARREVLEACGLYDACLSGSGDHLMAHVFAGALDSHCIPAMIGSGHKYAEHFARWAAGAHRVCAGRLGHVPGRVLHLWHGAIADRRYYWRNQEFKTLAFDPDRHLRREENGLWEWADAPAEIRAWASQLFVSRNEDGERAVQPLRARPAGFDCPVDAEK